MSAKEYVESLCRQYHHLAERKQKAVETSQWLSEQTAFEAEARVYDMVAEEMEGVLQLMDEEKPAGAGTPTSRKG